MVELRGALRKVIAKNKTEKAGEKPAELVKVEKQKPKKEKKTQKQAEEKPVQPKETGQKLIDRVISEINGFMPSFSYQAELPYYAELIGYLKRAFPQARFDVQKGSTRPDIFIEKIAIEARGPTSEEDLQSIADKCVRCSSQFENLIVVLFDIRVSKKAYQEWEAGMQKTFPNVVIVKK
jgi:hypothetical protein